MNKDLTLIELAAEMRHNLKELKRTLAAERRSREISNGFWDEVRNRRMNLTINQ